MMLDSFNPATDQRLMQIAVHTPAQMDSLLSKASDAQKQWANLPVAKSQLVSAPMQRITPN
jgi:acyl-CoA reductase-like NAD-dependent aldehyde dehydrogenase